MLEKKMMHSRSLSLAAIAALASSPAVFADYSNSLDSSAGWTVNPGAIGGTPPTGSSTANFGVDYNSLYGIPAAPSGTGTTGVVLKSNLFGGLQAGISISPTSLNLDVSKAFTVKFDVWSNYVAARTNSTEIASYGLGAETKAQVAGNNITNSILFGSSRDQGTSTNYRTYDSTAAGSPSGTTTYAAGSQTYTNTYYTTLFPSQTFTDKSVNSLPANAVTTVAGNPSFAWHTVTITGDGTNVVWAIDTKTIATDPLASGGNIVANGTDLFLGSYDINTSGSYTASNTPAQSDLDSSAPVQYNFEVFDNLAVTGTTTPEPTSLALIGVLGAGGLARRRRA